MTLYDIKTYSKCCKDRCKGLVQILYTASFMSLVLNVLKTNFSAEVFSTTEYLIPPVEWGSNQQIRHK